MGERHIVSEEILEFLKAWLEWATTTEDGYGHRIFLPYEGLCGALSHWSSEAYFARNLKRLRKAFKDCGLDRSYPFGEGSYDRCLLEDTQHKDPARLLWVKKTIKTTEEFLHENRH